MKFDYSNKFSSRTEYEAEQGFLAGYKAALLWVANNYPEISEDV